MTTYDPPKSRCVVFSRVGTEHSWNVTQLTKPALAPTLSA
jgi:hypothetical protein